VSDTQPSRVANFSSERGAEQLFSVGLARAFGGALIFSLPMLMTMEMWQLGFSLSQFRLALLLLVTIPLLVGLSHYMGFEETFGLKDDVVDVFVALAVGFIVPAIGLFLFSIFRWETPLSEIIGKISVQAVPASIGAMFAQSELGGGQGQKNRHAGYGGEIFIMASGALFLGLNVAPTEERVLIAYKTSAWHSVTLVLISLFIMHADEAGDPHTAHARREVPLTGWPQKTLPHRHRQKWQFHLLRVALHPANTFRCVQCRGLRFRERVSVMDRFWRGRATLSGPKEAKESRPC
jgi:putative integral membrane protein (TIGR02587 family)